MKIKFWQIGILFLVAGGIWFAWDRFKGVSDKSETVKIISPRRGHIQSSITATGTVLPKNRLQVKPPVSGRIEEVLVKEGQVVKVGDILVWMSSTDRAALLDAARGRGEAALKEWQDVYKPIPLLSPIDGEVIVGTIQPGQTVTAADNVVVLSDRLIVRAQVDETDIGKVQKGQAAMVTLDAYPDTPVKAAVDHIYYESKMVNNVTIYDVDLMPESVPAFFRSGMSANIDFILESREDALLLPLAAIKLGQEGSSVTLNNPQNDQPVDKVVELGIRDEKNAEILSGVIESDEVMMTLKKYSLPKSGGTNPFVPQRRR